MPQTQKSPTDRSGNLKNVSKTQADYTQFMQAVQACYPCASCSYLRLVQQPAGGFRRVCTFTGERIGKGGRPLCEFHAGGGA